MENTPPTRGTSFRGFSDHNPLQTTVMNQMFPSIRIYKSKTDTPTGWDNRAMVSLYKGCVGSGEQTLQLDGTANVTFSLYKGCVEVENGHFDRMGQGSWRMTSALDSGMDQTTIIMGSLDSFTN